MDSCHIKINHKGMIDGYIKCDDDISDCNVEIISKHNQIAMDNTIFEWYVAFVYKLIFIFVSFTKYTALTILDAN